MESSRPCLVDQQEEAAGGVAGAGLEGQAGAATEAAGMAAPPASAAVDVQSQAELALHADGAHGVAGPAVQQQGCEGFSATESHLPLEPLLQESALQVNGCTPDAAQEVAQGCIQSTNEVKPRRGRSRARPRHRKNPSLRKQEGSGRDLLQGSLDIMVEKGTPTEKAEPQGRGSGWCFLCHIDCITAEILKQHLAGKKHKRNLAKQNLEHAEMPQMDSFSEVEQKADAPDKMLQDVSMTGVMQQVITESTEMKQGEDLNSFIAAVMSLAEYKKKRKCVLDQKQKPKKRVRRIAFVNGTDTSLSGETAQKKSTLLEKCVVCNIICSSRSIFESHMAGRKHAARIHRLEKESLLKSNDENTIKGSVPAGLGIDGPKQTENEDACMIAVDAHPVTAEIAGDIATDTMKESVETCNKIEDACGTML